MLTSGECSEGAGVLEIQQDGYGFLRAENCQQGPNDVYISIAQIRRFNLRMGDYVEGKTRPQREGDRYSAMLYITSVNGLAETGEIINIDGAGNRVAETIFGHKKVYFVIGKNKLAEDYDKALWRARNIAGPKNAQRLNRKTPCAAKADRCYNCSSPDRICKVLSVFWGAPMGADCEVVLIKEDLGY